MHLLLSWSLGVCSSNRSPCACENASTSISISSCKHLFLTKQKRVNYLILWLSLPPSGLESEADHRSWILFIISSFIWTITFNYLSFNMDLLKKGAGDTENLITLLITSNPKTKLKDLHLISLLISVPTPKNILISYFCGQYSYI